MEGACNEDGTYPPPCLRMVVHLAESRYTFLAKVYRQEIITIMECGYTFLYNWDSSDLPLKHSKDPGISSARFARRFSYVI